MSHVEEKRTDEVVAKLQAVWTELDEQADRDQANDLSGSAAWCLSMRDRIDEVLTMLSLRRNSAVSHKPE